MFQKLSIAAVAMTLMASAANAAAVGLQPIPDAFARLGEPIDLLFTSPLIRAAQIDPGSYRLQMRLARMGGRARCEHARAAHALFPTAFAPAEAGHGCGK